MSMGTTSSGRKGNTRKEKADFERFRLESVVKAMFRFHEYEIDSMYSEKDMIGPKKKIKYFRATRHKKHYVVGYTFGPANIREDEIDKFYARFRDAHPQVSMIYMTNREFTWRAQHKGEKYNILLWKRSDIVKEIGNFIVKNYDLTQGYGSLLSGKDTDADEYDDDREEPEKETWDEVDDLDPIPMTQGEVDELGIFFEDEDEPLALTLNEIDSLGVLFEDEGLFSRERWEEETGTARSWEAEREPEERKGGTEAGKGEVSSREEEWEYSREKGREGKSVKWEVQKPRYLEPYHSSQFIESALAKKTTVRETELHYIPHHIYDMSTPVVSKGDWKVHISVNAFSGEAARWKAEDELESERLEGSIDERINIDEKEAYEIAGKKAKGLFVDFCRSMPEEAQRNIRLEALERYPFESMVQHNLIQLVSRGTYYVPVWYIDTDEGIVMINSLNLQVLKNREEELPPEDSS